ncbi:Lsr2 family protein [Actinoplanes sp. NPDC051859]|uniref:Lsr2 family protein n=1 Tax=Actinoplanes sp. NPDC051859 TaxID=3363909 RepID=UPI003794B315
MAKQIVTLLTDDLDGGEADHTVEFSLDGVNYTIDLSEKNTAKLRKVMDPYLAAATRVGRLNSTSRVASRKPAPARAQKELNQDMREWAAKNGFEVSDRGRIPSSVVEAYNAKH